MTVAGALSRIPLRSMYAYEVFEKNHIAQNIKTLCIVVPYTQAIPETVCRVRPVSRSVELTKTARTRAAKKAFRAGGVRLVCSVRGVCTLPKSAQH